MSRPLVSAAVQVTPEDAVLLGALVTMLDSSAGKAEGGKRKRLCAKAAQTRHLAARVQRAVNDPESKER